MPLRIILIWYNDPTMLTFAIIVSICVVFLFILVCGIIAKFEVTVKELNQKIEVMGLMQEHLVTHHELLSEKVDLVIERVDLTNRRIDVIGERVGLRDIKLPNKVPPNQQIEHPTKIYPSN